MENVTLRKARKEDAYQIWLMQRLIFKKSYETYKHPEDPGNESLTDVLTTLIEPKNFVFKIYAGEELVGMLCTAPAGNESRWVYKVGVLEEYQGKGYAKKALLAMEKYFEEDTKIWYLNVISGEKGAIHLYEKLGYQEAGMEEPISEGITLIFYRKKIQNHTFKTLSNSL